MIRLFPCWETGLDLVFIALYCLAEGPDLSENCCFKNLGLPGAL